MWFAFSSIFPSLPPWYLYSFAFVMGGLIGSFLNVCILRIPEEGVSIFYPHHSRCPTCETTLRWYDNIPVLSYLSLRGQCRYCKTPISIQYPLIELLTAIMAVAVVKRFGPSLAAIVFFAFVSSLIVITFIDMAYWIIPDVISLPGIPLGIIAAWAIGGPHLPTLQDAVYGAVLGGGVFFVISFGYEFLLKRPGLGMGDVKLLAMIGAFLGWQALPGVILLASAQGLLVAIVLYFFGVRQSVPEFEEDQETTHTETHSTDEAPTPTKNTETDEAKQADKSDKADKADKASTAEESVEAAAATTTTAPDTPQEPEIATPEEAAPKAPPASEAPAAAQDGLESEEEFEEEVGFRAVAIQFGPFLCLAAVESLFWGKQIATWWFQLIRYPL